MKRKQNFKTKGDVRIMANKNEMTQIKALEVVLGEEVERDPEVTAKVQEVLTSLIKKKENRKPKEVSEEDKAYTEVIKATLENAEKPMAIADIIAKSDFGKVLSSSKVTSLVKKIEGVVVTTEKKRNLYSIPAEEVEE